MQPYLDQSIMQPVGVKVTIRGGGELLLNLVSKPHENPNTRSRTSMACSGTKYGYE